MKNAILSAGLLLSALALGTAAQAQDGPTAPSTPISATVTLPTQTGTVTFPAYYLWEYAQFDMVNLANARTTEEIVVKPLPKR